MEVDVLTGDFKVLETDIVMDVGRSINPLIDIGQIEGAFVQGMGLYTLEELLYLNESADVQKGKHLLCTRLMTILNKPVGIGFSSCDFKTLNELEFYYATYIYRYNSQYKSVFIQDPSTH